MSEWFWNGSGRPIIIIIIVVVVVVVEIILQMECRIRCYKQKA